MNDISKSYRRILTTTSITGGATVINILIGVIKTKLAAVLLGPTGIGLIGLYQSFVSTASTLSGFGIATAATRKIAQENNGNEDQSLAYTLQTLFLSTILLGLMGFFIVWLSKDHLTAHLVGKKSETDDIFWLAIAVLFSVISASIVALIQGMREITSLAKLNILSGLISAVVGIGIIWKFEDQGLVAFVMTVPILTVLLGVYFVKKKLSSKKLRFKQISLSNFIKNFNLMARLGGALFLYALLEQITLLLIRSNIGNSLGANTLGQFQAAWTIAIMYLSIITGAMSSDFMPRIAEKSNDFISINKLINQQTEIGLLIATPVIILMIGYAPIIITLLYTNDFFESTDLMRLLLLADIIKLVSWPIGIALIGLGDGAAFSRQGPVQLALLYFGIYLLLPLTGLIAVGLIMLLTQSIGFFWGYRYIYKKTGYRIEKKIKFLIIVLSSLILSAYMICIFSELLGRVISTIFAILIALFSYKNIKLKINING